MPLRHFAKTELSEGLPKVPAPPNPLPSRMERLNVLVCGGKWGANDRIAMLYWNNDATAPGGGYWVAWEDPDPLNEAGVTIK